MKTLYLHVGTAKTGTTSIQYFCRENEDILARCGFCYPKGLKPYPYVSKAKNGHFLEATYRDENGERMFEEEARDFQEGIAMVNELFQTYDNVILSDEAIWRDLSLGHKDLFQKLMPEARKGGFQVKVIVYLRRQDKMVSSIWNQYVKAPQMRVTQTFRDFCKRKNINAWLDYNGKLKKISQEIGGKENVIVRRFEPKYFYGGDIFRDFMYAVGIPWQDDFAINIEMRNPRLSGNAVEIKRILNSLPEMGDRETHDFMTRLLLDCSGYPSAKKYSSEVFTPEEALKFLKKYEKGNRKVAQEYLGEDSLFDLDVADNGKWKPNNAYMVHDLTRFVGMCLLHQENELKLLKAEQQKLASECKKLREDNQNLRFKLKHPARTISDKIWGK